MDSQMADFASLTHKWRALPNNSTDSNKISKRNRQPVSCQPCRVRKLKCDRGHPCEACLKRGDDEACHYGKSTSSTSPQNQASSSKPSSGRAQDRLRQLENLVRQMIEPSNTKQPDQAAQPEQIDDSSAKEGPLNRERHGTHYTGSTHWSAILDQIQDLRSLIGVASPSAYRESPSSPFTSHPTDVMNHDGLSQSRMMSLFAGRQPLPLPQLLEKYLPPRKNVDRLLSTYFNSKLIPVPYIHTEQFNRQYDEFWNDHTGTETSPMWLSILFSILSMADKIRLGLKVEFETGILGPNPQTAFNNHDPTSQNESPASEAGRSGKSSSQPASVTELTSFDYMSASAQLLVLGDFTRPQTHLIEALCIHGQAKYSLSLDPNREIALMQSILVRQAYSMSYHRDCSNFPPGQFSVFEAEMRRRCWASIKQTDLMISFQLGIPMNVTEASWDTKPPQNLLDTDFDEDSKSLPEPRGNGEPTGMLYYVFKTQLMDVYAKILRHTLSFPQGGEAKSCEDTRAIVMNLDAEMRKASESIPPVMKVKPMSQSFSDPSWLIMLRTNLMFLVQKSFCVLHRKYMLSDTKRSGDDTTYSKRVVVDASSKMVNHFMDIHLEFQPGGQLSRDWWMLGAFTVNDFLLAVMLLCYSFWMERKKNIRRESSDSRGDVLKWLERDDEARSIFEALGRAKCVCEIYGRTSNESKRVAEVLWVVLDKFASNNEDKTTDSGSLARPSKAQSMASTSSQPSSFGLQSWTTQKDQDRLDMTPLSIQDVSIPSSGPTQSSPSTQGPNQSVSEASGYEATWTIVEAVPYKKQSQSHSDQIQSSATAAARRTQPEATLIQPTNTQVPTPSSIDGQQPLQPSDPALTMPVAMPLADNDPLLSLMDFSDDAAAMDWTSFDQFLGNFNFNYTGTPGATNPSLGPITLSPAAPFGQSNGIFDPSSAAAAGSTIDMGSIQPGLVDVRMDDGPSTSATEHHEEDRSTNDESSNRWGSLNTW